MPGFHTEWTVFPHGPVETIDDGILSAEGEIRMPLGTFPRRMTVAALNGGGTVVFSPVALHEPAMQEVEALGQPRFMVVPNGFHRLDAQVWKQRYPDVKVLCPPGARKRVEQAVAVDATNDVLDDGEVSFIIADGARRAESALLVQRGAGSTLVINDLVSHIRHPKGLGANIFARVFGFGVKRPQMAREVRWLLVNDKAALARQLRRWAAIPDLKRIIVSHGDIIENEPAEVLKRVALTLD
jgi:hypothetical protein